MSNRGRATPSPSEFKELLCDFCGSIMNVTRDVNGPTSWGGAMAKISHLHDSFVCPHIDDMWHLQAEKLHELAKETPSKVIEQLLLDEAKDIISKRKHTKEVSKFF